MLQLFMQEGGSGSLSTRAQPAQQAQPDVFRSLVQQTYPQLELDCTIEHGQPHSAATYCGVAAPYVYPPIVEAQHFEHPAYSGCIACHPGCRTAMAAAPYAQCRCTGDFWSKRQEDTERKHRDMESGARFTDLHIQHLVQLLLNTATKPLLAHTLMYVGDVHPSHLDPWIEHALYRYVFYHVQGIPPHRQSAEVDKHKRLWVRNILRCHALSSMYDEWERFESWLNTSLGNFPNLAFALGEVPHCMDHRKLIPALRNHKDVKR
jgi:hypothetical protein